MSGFNNTPNLPIFKKAELIFKLVESLISSFPEEDDYIQSTKYFMLENSMMLSTKIAGAEAGDLYSIRMQNAAIIRDHAMHLYTQVGSLRMHENYKELEYVDLIRQEIDAFRLLFVEWIEGFDTTNHIWDDWGLFNPPGALPPSENDWDDNTPFDPNDFFEDDDE